MLLAFSSISLGCRPRSTEAQFSASPDVVSTSVPSPSASSRTALPPPLDLFPVTPLEYSIEEIREGGKVERHRYEERCEVDLPITRCKAVDLDGKEPWETTFCRVDDRGLVLEHSEYEDGATLVHSPPEIQLPPHPTPGLRWTEHVELRMSGGAWGNSTRHDTTTSVITASSVCSDGIEVTRSTEADNGLRRTEKVVYCPGRGEVEGTLDDLRPNRPERIDKWHQQSEKP